MRPDEEKPEATDGWAEELAAELAERLDGWAIEREKVLSMLDIRSAKAARLLSRALRLAGRSLSEAAYLEDRKEKVFRVIELRRDALRLMASGASPVSREELSELVQLGAADIGHMVEEAGFADEASSERPTLAPPPSAAPPVSGRVPASKAGSSSSGVPSFRGASSSGVPSFRGGQSSAGAASSSHPTPPSGGFFPSSIPSVPASSDPAQSSRSSPAESGQRRRNEHVTATHSPDAIRKSRAQGLAPDPIDDGGLGDYIARIRRLKG